MRKEYIKINGKLNRVVGLPLAFGQGKKIKKNIKYVKIKEIKVSTTDPNTSLMSDNCGCSQCCQWSCHSLYSTLLSRHPGTTPAGLWGLFCAASP